MFTRKFAALAVLAAAAHAHAQASPIEASADRPAAVASISGESSSVEMTLAEALDAASRNHPALRGASADVDASAGAWMQAGARPNPELSLLQEGLSGAERTTTALLSQTIELGRKRGARLEVAAYGRQAAEAALDQQGAAVRADVVAAFYALLAAQRQLEVAQESAAIAARLADIAARRVKAGKVSPVEATKAQVAAATVQMEVSAASGRVDIAQERLNAATGLAGGARPVAVGDLESVPSSPALTALAARLDDAPSARIARANLLRSNAAASLERAKRISDITVSAGMKRVVTATGRDNQAVVGIAIPLPLFDTNKGAMLEAAHKAERANADLEREGARLRLELAQAEANYRTAIHEAQRLKTDILPAARQALEAMQRGYELGKFSFLDVLDAQRTLFQGQSQYLRALADAHAASADLGRIVGTPLAHVAQAATPTR